MNAKTKEVTTVEQLPVAVTPMDVLAAAIDKGSDSDVLEKLTAYLTQTKKDEARKAFDVAMAQFQAACPIIKKTAQADRYVYAPFDEIMRTIRPHLDAAGLSVRFNTETTGPLITAICTVAHLEGHSETSYFAAPVDENMRVNDTQKMGSANAYAKRYAIGNALNLAFGTEDDDGYSAGPPILDDEQKELQKKERASRPPQDPATEEQIALLKDHLESGRLNKRQAEYISANIDRITKNDAAGWLSKLANQ